MENYMEEMFFNLTPKYKKNSSNKNNYKKNKKSNHKHNYEDYIGVIIDSDNPSTHCFPIAICNTCNKIGNWKLWFSCKHDRNYKILSLKEVKEKYPNMKVKSFAKLPFERSSII